MILALVWLSISIPFVYAAQQQARASQKVWKKSSPANDNSNPLSGSTEEKTPNSNINEEYLHHVEDVIAQPVVVEKNHPVHSIPLYIAFHGELLSPPPKA